MSSNNYKTVLDRYDATRSSAKGRQSEAELEAEFVAALANQGYEFAPIRTGEALVANLRARLEELNEFRFSDDEWERFYEDVFANPNRTLAQKTRMIQDEPTLTFETDSGEPKNIVLFDKSEPTRNKLQVVNQFRVDKSEGAARSNRYDVAILVNGIPMVCVELKRRGVSLREAFYQIERYKVESFGRGTRLFEFLQLFVVSNGTETKYYSNTTRELAAREALARRSGERKSGGSFDFTSHWADARNERIGDLTDFARTFFAPETLLAILARYCVFTTDEKLLAMRPYQIAAAERVLEKIESARERGELGTVAAGGYVWHATGSGKTLTSFKVARLASKFEFVDKVLFVVDRKDLDYQTMREYDRFEKGAANGTRDSGVLRALLEDPSKKIVVTTIQKLSTFLSRTKEHGAFDARVVFIFDECHRSQFGEMRAAIAKAFKNRWFFGFTGTPIFPENAATSGKSALRTTEDAFGKALHKYLIADAIRDHNVLPFKVSYLKTISGKEIDADERVEDIDRPGVLNSPERRALIVDYILTNFRRYTYRGNGAERETGRAVDDATLEREAARGFNSIFAVSSIDAAIAYYREFKRQMAERPWLRLRIATIFSAAPEDGQGTARVEEEQGFLAEENSDSAENLSPSHREALIEAIDDYNQQFASNYDETANNFGAYYKDVSLKTKERKLDLLIVANMFLTGFDAPTLNALWVDKNLKTHGLLQAFSRTNRVFNAAKSHGNIVCFRNLEKNVDESIALFSNGESSGSILLGKFEDYFRGRARADGTREPGYLDLIQRLVDEFPLPAKIVGEEAEKEFIVLFGAVLKLRNLLRSYDEFEGQDPLSERDEQDYLSIYQDLREARQKRRPKDKVDITDDVVFEIELLKQVDVDLDFILELIAKYRNSHFANEEPLIRLRKLIDASYELRSKKELIEKFLEELGDREEGALERQVEDVRDAWARFVEKEREIEFERLIRENRLKADKARAFMESAFRNGELRFVGRELAEMTPPVSRFGGGDREAAKRNVEERLREFFDKFYGIVGS
ncbi:MAG: type I restriction endonuclease subunit R [Thermoguttaceae bacterium]|nr:type I restriction endonuclease subunit R [Thermoguttaceae bacterium]